jgi:hypothetical protein
MNTINQKTLITILVVAGAVIIAYKFLGTKKDKRFYAKYLTSNGFYGSAITNILDFDEDFLVEWYKAAEAGKSSFDYKGKTYNTQGGSAKK